jgi:rod shape-determining protein MreD
MKAWLLKLLNVPGLFLIASGMMVIQSTLFTSYPLTFLQPDGILLLTLWISMRRNFTEGGLLVLMLGYLIEIHSSAPRGMYMTHGIFIFLMTHFLSKNFHVLNKRSLILVGASMAVLSRLIILFILYLLNRADNEWRYSIQLILPSAIIHGALIPFAFQFFHRFDLWTLKNPKAEHRHEQDYYLDEEFI